ncbi:single-stranded DNA-binding protein [Rhodococcus sp. TAF43]|uniref:single-stranded DNA-binding protein n=1 Tax=unclassified Rhodococcus (in: high G+C Gram-positive bacteria) TaxID=192944 RepID=UPI000E0AB0F8|nr:single-stranded DNA-binding protein [Rhodococcus sp. AG1013]RDI16341.1 single-strand DNA-binding protein [Rhodococcus sp. AG1013]
MYETHGTVVGTVITDPVKRETTSGEEVMSFRMASNVRRRDRETGEWTDGGTLYLTVSCWRRLVQGVGASLMKGDPIIAHGELRTNEYKTRDGEPRSDLEMRATSIGPDLARCTAKLDRSWRSRGPAGSGGADESTAQPDEAEEVPDDGQRDVDDAVPALAG